MEMVQEICEKCRHCLSCLCGDEFDDCYLKNLKMKRKVTHIVIKKEQREQLEKAIADAGYEWDAEKKDLKLLITNGDDFCESENCDGEDYGIDGLWHAKNILEETLGKVDGYQTDDGILEHKCAIEAVNKLYKQKPTWSEEDKKKLNRIYYLIAEAANEHAFSTTCRLIGDKECVELQDFLKSLKQRMGG